jgi:flavin-dependent dehydrogenase
VTDRGGLIVVGGGPVGLGTAIEARLAGLEVTLIEQRTGPVDKACGEGLMPGALGALERWGVDPPGHPIAGIAYVDAGHRVEHRFRAAAGRGVRRTVLQAGLEGRARELGVRFVTAHVTSVEQDGRGVRVGGSGLEMICGEWLAACDGLHSRIRRLAGLEGAGEAGTRARPRRFGVRRHFRVAPWTDLVEVHWTTSTELYVTPVAEDSVGIAVLGPGPVDFAGAIAAVPELADRVAGAEMTSALLGAGPLRQSATRRRDARILLVGDASGYVDALTGEGLRVGFAQARAAVASIATGDPASYERAWSNATREARVITATLVRVAQSRVRGSVVPAAAHSPRAFGAVVERLAR